MPCQARPSDDVSCRLHGAKAPFSKNVVRDGSLEKAVHQPLVWVVRKQAAKKWCTCALFRMQTDVLLYARWGLPRSWIWVDVTHDHGSDKDVYVFIGLFAGTNKTEPWSAPILNACGAWIDALSTVACTQELPDPPWFVVSIALCTRFSGPPRHVSPEEGRKTGVSAWPGLEFLRKVYGSTTQGWTKVDRFTSCSDVFTSCSYAFTSRLSAYPGCETVC